MPLVGSLTNLDRRKVHKLENKIFGHETKLRDWLRNKENLVSKIQRKNHAKATGIRNQTRQKDALSTRLT